MDAWVYFSSCLVFAELMRSSEVIEGSGMGMGLGTDEPILRRHGAHSAPAVDELKQQRVKLLRGVG